MSITNMTTLSFPSVFSLMPAQYRKSNRVLLDFLYRDETFVAQYENCLDYLSSKASGFVERVGESKLKEILGCGFLLNEYFKATQEYTGKNMVWLAEVNGLIDVVNHTRHYFTELTNFRRVLYKNNPLIRNVVSFSEKHISRKLQKKSRGGNDNIFTEVVPLNSLWDKDRPSFFEGALGVIAKGYSWFSSFIFHNIRSITNETYNLIQSTRDINRDLIVKLGSDEDKYRNVMQYVNAVTDSLSELLGGKTSGLHMHTFSTMDNFSNLLETDLTPEVGMMVITHMNRHRSEAKGTQNFDRFLEVMGENGFSTNISQSWRNALKYAKGNY